MIAYFEALGVEKSLTICFVPPADGLLGGVTDFLLRMGGEYIAVPSIVAPFPYDYFIFYSALQIIIIL